MNRQFALAALGLLLSTGVFAQDASAPQGRRPSGPPPEAFTACAGKTEGAAVSITLPDGKTLAATCAKFGDKLAARPNNMPAPPSR